MAIVRRVLLLTLIAVSGVALISPLSARSAARPSEAEPEHLLANPIVGRTDVPRGGVLTARAGSVAGAASAPEAVAPADVDAPAALPMEATLVILPAAAPAPQRPTATYSGDSVWDALATCESGGNWAINTGNGYYGGLQFSLATWNGYGGAEFAQYPHQATREEQIIVAERLRAARGYQPWPSCRAKLGLP